MLVRITVPIVLCAIFALGCGGPAADYTQVDLVKAHGTITLDGQPLEGAVVTFNDPRDDTFSYGLTDSSGKYTLQFDSEMSGVKVGKEVVRISTTRKIPGLNAKPGAEEDGSHAAELVPARYNKKSELTADVNQRTTRFDFELNSK